MLGSLNKESAINVDRRDAKILHYHRSLSGLFKHNQRSPSRFHSMSLAVVMNEIYIEKETELWDEPESPIPHLTLPCDLKNLFSTSLGGFL